jgi:two-component system, NtrC family, response regulator AtoC
MNSMDAKDFAGLNVLIVEDDVMLSRRIEAQLTRLRAEVTSAGALRAARGVLAKRDFDFVLLDVNLPDGLGTELLKEKLFPAQTGVVVMTAHGAVTGAVEAMRLGALDYLVKPFEAEELPLVLEQARRAKQSVRAKEHQGGDPAVDGFYFGSSLAALQAHLEKILAADLRVQSPLPPVLILGETGTGKTTVARWLHQRGPRAGSEMVEVNCSALPETLAESELFGHERGAFTDARATRMGLFEAAHGGTLFLDEIPSLPLPLQAKVLLAIEDQKIRRVGGNRTIPVDVRVIAAANCDLNGLVAAGKFREDLYHRLDLYRINIPPLRERAEGILKFVEVFSQRICQKHRLPPRELSEAGRRRLLGYRWPGNVRELMHELERGIVFEAGETLDFAHLPDNAAAPTNAASESDWLNTKFRFPSDGFTLHDAINRLMHLALAQSQGNISAAARLMGVPHDFIRYRLGKKSRKPDWN